MIKLGYLGPPGTFSHTAALIYATDRGCMPVCCPGLEAVFRRVQTGRLDAGLVPAENSTGGAVAETMDLLSLVNDVYITGEMLMPVRQHLLARPGTGLRDVRRIYSHPQALAQCRRYLHTHLSGVPVVETASTASAAMTVSGLAAPVTAAVGSISAAQAYGLEVLSYDIQDNHDNVTRFLVLGREKSTAGVHAKTSLVLAVKDRPGALYHILREFALRKISLTRIESRPARKKLGDYIFFIDFLGSEHDPAVREAIHDIGLFTLWTRVLGSYPVYQEPDAAATGGENHRHGLDLSNIRAKIDLVDSEIMRLFTMRQHLVDEVARIKAGRSQIVDRQREDEIINRVRELARANDLDPVMVEKIYRLILRGSVLRQRELLGGPGVDGSRR